MKRKNSENANRISVIILLSIIILGGICASVFVWIA